MIDSTTLGSISDDDDDDDDDSSSVSSTDTTSKGSGSELIIGSALLIVNVNEPTHFHAVNIGDDKESHSIKAICMVILITSDTILHNGGSHELRHTNKDSHTTANGKKHITICIEGTLMN